jgi:hypothetical protein
VNWVSVNFLPQSASLNYELDATRWALAAAFGSCGGAGPDHLHGCERRNIHGHMWGSAVQPFRLQAQRSRLVCHFWFRADYSCVLPLPNRTYHAELECGETLNRPHTPLFFEPNGGGGASLVFRFKASFDKNGIKYIGYLQLVPTGLAAQTDRCTLTSSPSNNAVRVSGG